jgi:uncharacterized damage-inducible protein DinB
MKLARAALLLVVPAALTAQQPAPNTAGGPMTTVFRNRIMNLHRNLMQAFDSIPGDRFGFKPTPAQQTIGYVAQHLANDNYFFCSNFGDKKAMRPEDETTTPDSVKATWPKDKLVTSLKAAMAFCQDAFTQLEDSRLADQITVTAPNGQTRQVTRMQYVLGHALDLQDHYAQIANYMRLNGMLPPTALPRPRPSGT